MALFGLVKDKCVYCRTPMENGYEIMADVKVPGLIGTFEKKFCSAEHVASYKKEIKNRPKRPVSSCCG